MSEVRAKYGQLNEVLGTFNEKVSEVLSKAEVQFLQAYRANMQAVYEEKRELEAKLAEAGRQQSNDQQMRNLERDREWYKDRKNKLENQAVAMQKDLLYMHVCTMIHPLLFRTMRWPGGSRTGLCLG